MQKLILFLFISALFSLPTIATADSRDRGAWNVPEGSILRFGKSINLLAGEHLTIGQVNTEESFFGLLGFRLICMLENRRQKDNLIPAGRTMVLALSQVEALQGRDDGPLIEGVISYYFGESVQLNCMTIEYGAGRTALVSVERAGAKFSHLQEVLDQMDIQFVLPGVEPSSAPRAK